jgi:DnaJ-class molecular chaperone
MDCPRCYGTGWEKAITLSSIIDKKCSLCKGTGKLNNPTGLIKWV